MRGLGRVAAADALEERGAGGWRKEEAWSTWS
jgi:hypothetical protein